MKKYIKKHHIRLGWAVFLFSSALAIISILWDFGFFNLPSSLVYYSRYFAGMTASEPKPTFELPVKFHKQEHALSCEAATLKIVFDYHGLVLSESEIINKMPFDSTPKVNGVWGDPDKGFVGDIDGKMPATGYGIHWEPLAETARNWKRAEIIENGLAQDIVGHLLAGRPVIVWGYLGRGRPVSWVTSEGKRINTIVAEHTRVVYGFRGSADDPAGFFVMDPTYGHSYWEKNIFMRNWDSLGRTGVVVYP